MARPREGIRRPLSRRTFLKGTAAGAAVVGLAPSLVACMADSGPNPVSDENTKTGTSNFQTFQKDSIQGFATDISVNAGDTVSFKVDSPSTNYRIDIYRLGWYGGAGATLVTSILPSVTLPQIQLPPKTDATTGLVDCGNWAVSASWPVPANAVSGVYQANFIRLDSEDANQTYFVVRNDGRTSDILYQTSDTTWHAYNRYGGNSFYYGSPDGRCYKVSYNRPFQIDGFNDFYQAEYAMVRWLERNGYDVAYSTGVDTDRRGSELLHHKVFLSSGHDEYWSGQQRANVEAARNSGVHLAFFSGNEVFWKTRWEPSTDASSTPYRTLVCYKETLDAAKIDPTPVWTGTWRDPSFSPPADGDRPEIALTGQYFGAINVGDDPSMTVPASYGNLRFWRNTGVATAVPGSTVALGTGTLGYEWDDDRGGTLAPPGRIFLSQMSYASSQVLQDYGAQYAITPSTHHLTMYRHSSGALVFGAGTCQWAWGLDPTRERQDGAEDPNVQQATVNLLADMGCEPHTLQSNLVAASASADNIPPVTTVTSPAAGAQLPVGTPVTVTGTATDAGGGVVATIEVSTDGGNTWSRAAGTTSWSHTFIPTTLGSLTIQTRGTDDSLNIETPSAGTTVSIVHRGFPCSIWDTSQTPGTASTNDPTPLELGVRFRCVQEGFITGIRFYKGAGNTGTHIGRLWSNTGALLATCTFTNETDTGWQSATFSRAVPIDANTTYVASYSAPNGFYSSDLGYLTTAYDVWPLRALADGEDGPNGVFTTTVGTFPATTWHATNYWVDVIYDITDHLAPSVVDWSPAADLEAVTTNTTVRATFSDWMNQSTLAITVTDPSNEPIAGTTTYDDPTRTATLTPSAPLAQRTRYSVSITGSDNGGEAMAAPASWSFTTVGPVGTYPTTLWDTSATPAIIGATNAGGIELGVKIRADLDGFVKALRFYKAAEITTSHTGHLWQLDGTLIGTCTFTNETSSGWQQASFDTPIAVSKGAVYVASYFSPTGVYSADNDYFGGKQATSGVLHGLADGDAGPNAVYLPGASGFPTNSWQASNYWVDLVYDLAPDTTPPSVVDQSPAPGIVSVATTSTVTATFDAAINPSTLTFTLAAQGGGSVAGAVSYDPGSFTATFTPNAALAQNTVHVVTVKASDTAGNAMATPVSWTFRTVGVPGSSPATIWDTSAVPATAAANDSSALELGVKFRSDVGGVISGIRFYKRVGNTGTHIGHLWTLDGTLLGSCTFTSETGSGWQQANFSAPIPITANTTYIASYQAPQGHYAATAGGFAGTGADRYPLHALADGVAGGNGVFAALGGFPNNSYAASNYWVDVVFQNTTSPTVTDTKPGNGEINVSTTATVSATFSEAVIPSSVSFTLTGPGGNGVPASLGYDSSTNTSVLTPASQLSPGTAYTATVAKAQDLSGNAMAAAASWTFTTLPATDFMLWPPTQQPAVAAANDSSPFELGVKIRVDTPGSILGIRFYKGTGNGGTHIGNLWGADGTLLGSCTFTTETVSGWQQALFKSPIPITSGTTYIASYEAPQGHYAIDGGYFTGKGADNGPLHALASGVDGPNAVYSTTTGTFPTLSFSDSNYWVDVIFREGS